MNNSYSQDTNARLILLRCQNVSKTFQTRQTILEVLSNIEFHIYAGEMIQVFGKSGQGKSVLLSLLSGLDNPTSGDIYFLGERFRSYTRKQKEALRRTQIGIIFQNLNLIPSWTALENVEAALEDILISPKVKRSRAQTLLEEMGLANRLHHLPGALSMGEQQRVAIARTLIRRPKLLLADEPTGDLDAETGDHIVHLLRSYIQKTQASLLVTTHGSFPDMQFDRTYILNNGILSLVSDKPERKPMISAHSKNSLSLISSY